jgi:hypothetical protein
MSGILRTLSFAVLVITAASIAAPPPPPPPPTSQPGGVTLFTVPERLLPDPAERGKPYPVPPTKWETRPVLWGWSSVLPDGSGLAFGGVHQTADDGIAHTSVKDGANWKPIVDDLRKANPLQPRVAQVRALRDACKDAIAAARNIYFEGAASDEQAKLVASGVNPSVENLSAGLGKFIADLKGQAGLGEYEAGQVAYAMKHLNAAVGWIKPITGSPAVEPLADLRRGQIELEMAGEAFDAEPPPRALSLITWEPKTKLFVIFGGDHMDYQTNDLWVFDPAKSRWQQRHATSAPEPRGDHHFEPLGDGRIAMFGGYAFIKGRIYQHCGPARWIYDVQKNAWSADDQNEPMSPGDIRSAQYWPPAAPESAMMKARPDATANEAKLKAIPVNTWVRLKTPEMHKDSPGLCRDWGTTPFDCEHDIALVYAGGHASYAGNDVARYHLATDRWEISDPMEVPLGCCGTNEQYPSGFNYNQRPWVKKHVWNSQAYDPDIRKMIMAGVNDEKVDRFFYVYDPMKADWVSRHRLTAGQGNGSGGVQLRHTKHGVFEWYGDTAWLLDDQAMEWKKLNVKGKMPNTSIDNCGMVYDPKRGRMLFFTMGYAKPYDGQVFALDLNTLEVTPLNPEGMTTAGKWTIFPREAAYLPKSDLFIIADRLRIDRKPSPNLFPAFDSAKNRWVTVKLPFEAGERQQQFPGGVSNGMAYDAKRDLLWVIDSSWAGGIWVLRFDPAKTEIAPLKDALPPAEEKK